MTISIQPITTIEESRIIEQLQIDIWHSSDREAAPDHILLTIAKEGGVVLLALDEAKEKRPVGFGYGFPGFDKNKRLKLVSHQVGVLPAYQNRGVGHKIKLAQREAALAYNIDRITWTFDPLQGPNARFNMRKLGATCNTYIRELYGVMRNGLNLGLPSDRFKVDWWLRSTHVIERLAGQAAEQWLPASECPILNPGTGLANGLYAPAGSFDLPTGHFCLVEIPANIQQLKADAPDLARQWHQQTREIFEIAFAGGYTAIDLLRRAGRNYYMLQKDWQPT